MYRLHAIRDWASLVIHLALEDCGADFEIVWEDYDAGTLATPAYRAISPFGLIPAMETPGGPVFETGAILLWLAERHPGLAPAPDHPDRAAFLSWLLFTANTVHPLVMQLIHPYRAGGEAFAGPVGAMAQAELGQKLAPLDAALARGAGFATPAIAYYLGVMLRWAQAFPHDPAQALDLAPFPAIRQLLASAEARPAAQAVARIEGIGPTPFTALKG